MSAFIKNLGIQHTSLRNVFDCRLNKSEKSMRRTTSKRIQMLLRSVCTIVETKFSKIYGANEDIDEEFFI